MKTTQLKVSEGGEEKKAKVTVHTSEKRKTGAYEIPKIMIGHRLIKNTSTQGESIEQRIERITANKEPIETGAPLIYTRRSQGVPAQTDIRTDKWDAMVETHNTLHMGYNAKTEKEKAAKNTAEGKKNEGTSDTGGEQQK